MSRLLNIKLEADLSDFDSTVTDGGDLSQSASAALAGTAGGLRVNIDDTNVIYGQNNFTTLTSGIYNGRLYIDPNGLTMASGDRFVILNFKDGGGGGRARITLSYNGGNYELGAELRDDGGTYSLTSKYVITDAPHYVEASFIYGSDAVTADAVVKLWIDGDLKESKTGFILFTRSQPAQTRMGAVESIDAGTSGVLYLDEFIANDDGTLIGTKLDAVNIDHETGDLTQYTSASIDGGDLSVTAGAALVGSFGLQVLADDANVIRGLQDFPILKNSIYRYRFYFDPNGQGSTFQVLAELFNGTYRTQIESRLNAGNQQIRMNIRDDANAKQLTAWFTITDAMHYIEGRVQYAATSISIDATAELYVDGVLATSKTGVDLFNKSKPNQVRLGHVAGNATPTRTYYLDDLVVRDSDVEIGSATPQADLLKSGLSGNLKGNLVGGLR